MADRSEQIRRAGSYYLIGIIILALSILARGELALTALLCVFAAGFMLAGHLLWKNSAYAVLALSAALLYFSAGGWLAAGLLFLLLLGLVLFTGYGIFRNGSLSSVVAVSTVGTAVLFGLFFAVYLYATQGNLSMEIITGPLDEISNALDDEIYAMVHQLYANYPSEQLDALVTMALTQKDYMFEMILLYMPGLIATFIMAAAYVAQALARGLTAKKYPGLVSTERLADLRISRVAAGTFVASMLLGMLTEGAVSAVFMNYVMILSAPLFIAGVVCAYRFLTRNTERTGVKAVVVILLVLSCCGPYIGLFIDFTSLYIILGVVDSFTGWRARFKKANGRLNS